MLYHDLNLQQSASIILLKVYSMAGIIGATKIADERIIRPGLNQQEEELRSQVSGVHEEFVHPTLHSL
jgi:hypothetical protein